MDYLAYRKKFFIDPTPEARFRFKGTFNATLYYVDFQAAVEFYSRVLGPPAYVEGEGTRGWPVGDGWLTLLQGKRGNPQNVEIAFELNSVEEAHSLQRAFLSAGATGPEPADQLMYRPIRACPVVDPFGVEIMIFAALLTEK